MNRNDVRTCTQKRNVEVRTKKNIDTGLSYAVWKYRLFGERIVRCGYGNERRGSGKTAQPLRAGIFDEENDMIARKLSGASQGDVTGVCSEPRRGRCEPTIDT